VVAAIKERVTVQPGGVIEIRSPELTPGTSAEVIVLVEASAPTGAQPLAPTWASFIGSGRGGFKSVAEVDAYIRGLRDEWDR
jgi:hypothetical protein